MEINLWGIFFFIVPALVLILLGNISLILVIIEYLIKKFKGGFKMNELPESMYDYRDDLYDTLK